MQLAVDIDKHALSGGNIPEKFESKGVQGHAFGGKHVLAVAVHFPVADHEGPDSVSIAKAEHSEPGDQPDHRIGALAAEENTAESGKNICRGRILGTDLLQLVGKNIEQDLGIRTRIEMTHVTANDRVGEFVGVGQIAVVREADAERRIDVERLGLVLGRRARRRVAHVADSHVARQLEHMPPLKDVANEAILLAHVYAPVLGGYDPGSVLATVLQDGQGIIDGLVDRALGNDSDDSTHLTVTPWPVRTRPARCRPALPAHPAPSRASPGSPPPPGRRRESTEIHSTMARDPVPETETR